MEKRLQKHLAVHKGFTNRAKDWRVVFTEEFSDKSLALIIEKQIKKWKSSSMICKLIEKEL